MDKASLTFYNNNVSTHITSNTGIWEEYKNIVDIIKRVDRLIMTFYYNYIAI